MMKVGEVIVTCMMQPHHGDQVGGRMTIADKTVLVTGAEGGFQPGREIIWTKPLTAEGNDGTSTGHGSSFSPRCLGSTYGIQKP